MAEERRSCGSTLSQKWQGFLSHSLSKVLWRKIGNCDPPVFLGGEIEIFGWTTLTMTTAWSSSHHICSTHLLTCKTQSRHHKGDSTTVHTVFGIRVPAFQDMLKFLLRRTQEASSHSGNVYTKRKIFFCVPFPLHLIYWDKSEINPTTGKELEI